jgi:predicted RNA-binding protein with TRAM domain
MAAGDSEVPGAKTVGSRGYRGQQAGVGVARVQGFVVFVKSGKARQKVKVKIDEVGNRFAKATIVS